MQIIKVQQIDYAKEWEFIILRAAYTLTGCLWPEGVLEWLHSPHTQTKMVASYIYLYSQSIFTVRIRSRGLFLKIHSVIFPYNKQQFFSVITT